MKKAFGQEWRIISPKIYDEKNIVPIPVTSLVFKNKIRRKEKQSPLRPHRYQIYIKEVWSLEGTNNSPRWSPEISGKYNKIIEWLGKERRARQYAGQGFTTGQAKRREVNAKEADIINRLAAQLMNAGNRRKCHLPLDYVRSSRRQQTRPCAFRNHVSCSVAGVLWRVIDATLTQRSNNDILRWLITRHAQYRFFRMMMPLWRESLYFISSTHIQAHQFEQCRRNPSNKLLHTRSVVETNV